MSTLTRPAVRITLAVAALGALVIGFVIARPASGPDDLSILASVLLGIVEGITEYLPVSSTGHLLVSQQILGLGGTEQSDLALDTYAICIQAGAILAVLMLYRSRVTQMVSGAMGRDDQGRRLLFATIIAFTLTAVLALLLEDPVRSRLFGTGPIAVAWVIGGLAIFILVRSGRLDRAGAAITEITYRQAAIIGAVQALALWPGVSRSLTTIVAATLVGLSLTAAVEFSFILGLATLTAATAYEALKNGQNLIDTFGILTPLIGLVVAFISAAIAIRWMVSWLQERGFEVFGWYRLAIGVGAGIALATGAL
jgi:undecaprenyl-diphosphatase